MRDSSSRDMGLAGFFLGPGAGGVVRRVHFPDARPQVVRHDLGTRAACFPVVEKGDGSDAAFAEAAADVQAGLDLENEIAIVASKPCSVNFYCYPVASEPEPR